MPNVVFTPMQSRALRVLYDDSLARNPAGTGTFVRGLLPALQSRAEVDVIVSHFRATSVKSVDVSRKPVVGRVRSAAEHLRYFAFQLPARARAQRCDVIFCPTQLGPLRGRTPSVITVLDLSPIAHAGTLHWVSRAYLQAMLRVQLRRSRAVCTISQAVATEIATRFPRLPPARLHVVYPAPDPDLLASSPIPVPGLAPPFFLIVGTLEPRKNHVTALRAFATYLERKPSAPQTLVLAGSPGWLYQPVLDAIRSLKLEDRVRRLGHVEPGQLAWLYRQARALLFPSLYEGFGIPVVDAFALGCPVIASRIPSVVEVVGDGAATLLDPVDVEQWASAIEAAASTAPDEATRHRASKQASAFTWEASAAALVDALALAASQGRGSLSSSQVAASESRPAPDVHS
jgi:glycosyltransferase involved in cell wall biosynthesis